MAAALASIVAIAPAEAAWRQASSDHFVVYSEATAKDLEAYASRLQRFDQAMRYMRGLPDSKPSPGNRLTVDDGGAKAALEAWKKAAPGGDEKDGD